MSDPKELFLVEGSSPQGSVLGPMLFSVFVEMTQVDLPFNAPLVVRSNLNILVNWPYLSNTFLGAKNVHCADRMRHGCLEISN